MDPDTKQTIRLLTKRIETLERAVGLQNAFPEPLEPPVKAPARLQLPATPPVRRGASSDARKEPTKPMSTKTGVWKRPAVRAPTPSSKRTPQGRDLENLLGAAVLGRLGIAAVVLAAGYFAQLAYRHMTDVSKVGALYGVSAMLLGLGIWLRKRAPRSYIALMWGGSLAVAYIAGVAARLRYDLVSAPVALLMLTGASAYGQYLAYKLKHKTLATVALAGAFSAPLLVDAPTNQSWFLCAYLLLLHTWSAWCQRKWSWDSARLVGIVGTILVAGVWLSGYGPADTTAYLCCYLYVAGLIAPEWLAAMKGRDATPSQVVFVSLLLLVVPGGLWCLSAYTQQVEAATAIVGAVLVLAALRMPRQESEDLGLQQVFASVGLVLLTVGAPLLRTAFDLHFIKSSAFTAYATAASAIVAWLLRDRLRLSARITALGATIAVVATIWKRPSTFTALPGIAASIPITLLILTRNSGVRAYGLVLGLILLWGYGNYYHQPEQLSLVLVIGGAFVAAVMLFARFRRDKILAGWSVAAFLVVSGAWILLWLVGELGPVTQKLLAPPSMAAWVIAAMAIFHLSTAREMLRVPRLAREQQHILRLAVVGLLYAAFRRETLAWHDYLPETRALVTSCTLGGTAIVLAGFARLRNARLFSALSLLFILWAAVRGGLDVLAVQTHSMEALQLACVSAPAVVASLLMPRAPSWARWLLPLALLTAAVTWAANAVARGPVTDVFNPVFLSGIGLVVTAWLTLLRSNQRAKQSEAFIVATLLFAYVVGATELWAHAHSQGDWSRVLMSLYSALFGGVALALGFAKKIPAARYLALGGFGLIALKVGLYDLAGSPTPLRILVTGGLGAIFLVAAYAYARTASNRERKDVDDGDQKEAALPGT